MTPVDHVTHAAGAGNAGDGESAAPLVSDSAPSAEGTSVAEDVGDARAMGVDAAHATVLDAMAPGAGPPMRSLPPALSPFAATRTHAHRARAR